MLTASPEIATTSLWVNATGEELWPSAINSSLLPDSATCSIGSDNDRMLLCPSAEWQLIQRSMSPDRSRDVSTDGDTSVVSASTTANDFVMRDQVGEIRLNGQRSTWSLLLGSKTWYAAFRSREQVSRHRAVGTQSTVTDALETFAIAWSEIANLESSLSQPVHSVRGGYFEPFVSTECAFDILNNSNYNDPISIPQPYDHIRGNNTGMGTSLLLSGDLRETVYNVTSWAQSNSVLQETNISEIWKAYSRMATWSEPSLIVPDTNKSGIWRILKKNPQNNVFWIDVPWTPSFDQVSIAAIIVDPQVPASHEQKNMMVCSISAWWGMSTLNVSTRFSPGSKTTYESSIDIDSMSAAGQNISGLEPILSDWINSSPSSPNVFAKVIKISSDWADLLNPIIRPSNVSVFNQMFAMYPENVHNVGKRFLPVIVANALSRMAFKGSIPGPVIKFESKPQPCSYRKDETILGFRCHMYSYITGPGPLFETPRGSENLVKFQVDTKAQGYAYSLSGIAQRLAAGVMMIYITLVLCHVFYTTVTGISSSAWDTVAELTSLAMQSSPTNKLRYTGAGITHTGVFENNVRIMAKTDPDGENEHLELVFADDDDEVDRSCEIQLNKAYE